MDRHLRTVAPVQLVAQGNEIGFGTRGDMQRAALGRQHFGDGAAAYLARAGNDRRLAGQFLTHAVSPSVASAKAVAAPVLDPSTPERAGRGKWGRGSGRKCGQ